MNHEPSVARLPPVVRGLAAVSGLNDVASEMVYPLLPAFIVGTLGGSAATLGALDGAADLAASLLRFISSRFADQPGRRRRFVFGGYALAIAVRPVMALAELPGIVVALRVIDRVGKGLRSPARDATISDAVTPAVRGRAFGLQRAFDHGGAMIGSLVAWALLQFGHLVPRAVIAGSVVPGVLALVVLAWTLGIARQRAGDPLRRPERSEGLPGLATHEASRATDPGSSSLPSERRGVRFWPPVLALTLLVVTRLPETLLLLHLQRGGIAVAAIPLAWAGLHLVRSSASYPAGRLVDAVGERGVVALAGLLGAVTAFALSKAVTPFALIAAFLAFGLVAGIGEPAERTLVAKLAPKGSGRAFGEAQAAMGVAALAAGIGYGVFVDAHGSAAALFISAIASVLATGVWLGVAHGTASPPRQARGGL